MTYGFLSVVNTSAIIVVMILTKWNPVKNAAEKVSHRYVTNVNRLMKMGEKGGGIKMDIDKIELMFAELDYGRITDAQHGLRS